MFDSTKFPLTDILANTVTTGNLELNSEVIISWNKRLKGNFMTTITEKYRFISKN